MIISVVKGDGLLEGIVERDGWVGTASQWLLTLAVESCQGQKRG